MFRARGSLKNPSEPFLLLKPGSTLKARAAKYRRFQSKLPIPGKATKLRETSKTSLAAREGKGAVQGSGDPGKLSSRKVADLGMIAASWRAEDVRFRDGQLAFRIWDCGLDLGVQLRRYG